MAKVSSVGRYLCKALLAAPCVTMPLAQADHDIEEIVIVGESKLVEHSVTLEGDALRIANTGDLLKSAPGANLNRNGPLTALPQYRGASGDRVNVGVDGMPVVAGGPNLMDSPVSSVPGANVKTLSVSRGIASVSAGQETLGGHIAIASQQGDFTDEERFRVHARGNSLASSDNTGLHASLLSYVANSSHKLGASYTHQEGNNSEFPGGEIPNTFFRRDRLNGFYSYRGDAGGFGITASRNNTGETGTASLPMDIIFIDSDAVHVEGYRQLGEWDLSASLGRQQIDHLMDNYSLRLPPTMVMGAMTTAMRRSTYAEGEQQHGRLALSGPLADGTVTLGTDYSATLHDATISDPDNALFLLENYKGVERDINGWYAEWVRVDDTFSWEFGARLNRVRADADPVAIAGMSAMVAMNTMPLVAAFNGSDRVFEENNVDLVAKTAYGLTESIDLSLGLARKTRAPSYQELYLWSPLQSTGGLADGRNYVGNLDLDSETADEINLGLDLRREAVSLSFQMFYRQVDGYIQGTPEISSPYLTQIQFLSRQMGGKDALQFNNVDAELYGADLGYDGTFGSSFYYRGTLSYVRGKRDDVVDNLYRIAPLNHSVTLGARLEHWDLSLTSELVARQGKVASYNDEQPTAGYGLLHVNARWHPTKQLQLVAGVDNLFNKEHAMHLNGYNRIKGADVPAGARLPGPGRSFRLGVSLIF